MNVCAHQSPQAPALVRVRTLRQDATVSTPAQETIEADKIGRRLSGERVGVYDQSALVASADKDGNFLPEFGRPQFDQVQSFVSAQKTLDMFERYAGRRLPWAFASPTLTVAPHLGEGVNAYYVRWQEAVSFYYFDSPQLHKRIQSAQSTDVVAHETGHAVLDGLKPLYSSTFDRETRAFHEAFGDCAAMLYALTKPETCRELVRATEPGAPLPDSSVSRMAEEFGTAVRLLNHDAGDDRPYLRNNSNDWFYVDPQTLPADGPRDVLSAESHTFCQVFGGAFYRCLSRLFQAQDGPGEEGERSAVLGRVAEQLGQIFVLGVELAGPTVARYADVAAGMLSADRLLFGGEHQQALQSVFAETRLLTATPQAPPELVLESPVTDSAGALDWLRQHAQALGVEGNWQPLRVTCDDRGTRMEFNQTQSERLSGPVVAAVDGGLTLGFDLQGRLVHRTFNPVDAQRLAAEEAGWRSTRPDDPAIHLVRGPQGQQRVERQPIWVD